jgi:hypothetical protein
MSERLDRSDDIVDAIDKYVAECVRQGRPFDSLGDRVSNRDVVEARRALRETLRRFLVTQ